MTSFHPDELRLVVLSAPAILKMLKAREDRVVNRIYGDFRAGKTDQIPAVAELAVIRDMIHEIQSVVQTANKEQQP
jgi:hypothetical protein